MKIAAARPLALQPSFLGPLSSGGGVTLCHEPLKHAYLTAYSPDLALSWNVEVQADAIGVTIADPYIWVIDRSGVSAYDELGRLARQVPFGLAPGMQVGAV